MPGSSPLQTSPSCSLGTETLRCCSKSGPCSCFRCQDQPRSPGQITEPPHLRPVWCPNHCLLRGANENTGITDKSWPLGHCPSLALPGSSPLQVLIPTYYTQEMEAWTERPRMLAKPMPLCTGKSKEGNDRQSHRGDPQLLKGGALAGRDVLAPAAMVMAHLAEVPLGATPLSPVASYALAGVSLIPRKCGHWHKDSH